MPLVTVEAKVFESVKEAAESLYSGMGKIRCPYLAGNQEGESV